MKKRAIAIIGGGIGGLTLARLLAADGHQVTIIERADDFSAQGHSIGFRGVGFQVMDELGLRQRMEQTGRGYSITRSLTLQGEPLRTVSAGAHAQAVGGVAVTQRGLLHAALREGLPPEIELRFGVKPVEILQTDADATVKLSDGSTITADVVVGADGGNSAVRAMVMPGIKVLDCGGVYAGLEIKTDHGLPINEIAAFYGTARLISFYPIGAHRIAVVIYQDDSYEAPPAENTAAAWGPYLQRVFADAAEPVRRILAGVQAGDDIYHDRIRQVPPQQVAEGRVALLGDAGYAPTFFSGNGAALAAVGAYVLAKCLRNNDDDATALQAYQACIMPLAATYQANANQLRGLLFSHSKLKNALRRIALRYMPDFIFARRVKKHYRGEVRLSDIM